MERILFSSVIVIVILAAIVWLQIFLSKRERKWPGLVLPIIAFLFSLIFPLNMMALPGSEIVSLVFQILIIWLLGNIPTIILMAIYFSCRRKRVCV